jgi:Nitroreductase family
MTSRRTFLRVAGTSAVILAAGGVGLTQCDPMPEAAVEAWNGPAPDVRDPRVRALSYALLAPNPHNMQPWIVDLREPDTIVFTCDRTRLLPETDPYARQIVIGCGAFLELLRMAAAEQGFRAEITPFPAGEWPAKQVGDVPLCRVVFLPDASLARDPLFAQALKRRTNRNAYDTAPLETAAGDAIGQTMAALPVRFGWTQQPGELAKLRDVAKRAWIVEMTKDTTYHESTKVFRITGEEISKHRDGLSFHGPLFWWLNATGLFTQAGANRGDAFIREQTLATIDPQLAKIAAFGWIVTSENDRRAQLDAGAAYARANLKATELGLSMQPLSQALQEFPEMLPVLAEHKRALGLPDSDTVQMFFRLGRASPVEPSPRRKLDDIIRA